MPESGKTTPILLPRLAVRALSASLLLAGFMIYSYYVWPGAQLSFPFTSKALWVAVVVFAGGLWCLAALMRRLSPKLSHITARETMLLALCGGLAVCLFSSGAAHPWFFIILWFGGRYSTSCAFALLTVVGAYALLVRPLRRKSVSRLLALLLVTLQAASFAALVFHTGFRAIYRDDHPSFLFRIKEFVETYPSMVVFNPWWNAGVVNAVGASSGVGSLALPFFPFWKMFPVHACYTAVLGFVLIVAVPLLTLLSLRAIRASRSAALAGAILSLCVSRAFFVWGLHFGTVGAVCSMSTLPMFALLLYRIFILRRTDLPSLGGLLVASFLLAQWPPCLIMAGFLLVGCLLNVRRFRLRVFIRLACVLAALLLLLAPNIMGLLASRDLFRFVAGGSAADTSAGGLPPAREWLQAILAMLSKRLPETHPVITFLGIGGLAVLPHRRLRRFFAPAVIGMLLLAAWGPLAVPRLQLDRMALPAIMLAIVPAAILVGQAFDSVSPRLCAVRSGLFALLLLGGMTVAALYGGEGYAPYKSMPPVINSFAEAVRREVPSDGRLLFYGSTVHSFGGGHVAYLPILTGREMMACDYYHFPPKMVEYDYPPRPWRKTSKGIADFMRLYGATHLATTNRRRADFIRQSGLFTEIFFMPDGKPDTSYGITLFALKGATGGRIHSGDATLGAEVPDVSFNHLRVYRGVDRETILRYNWNPYLTAGDDAVLEPVEVAPGVNFIRVRFTGNDAAVIRYGRKGK